MAKLIRNINFKKSDFCADSLIIVRAMEGLGNFETQCKLNELAKKNS